MKTSSRRTPRPWPARGVPAALLVLGGTLAATQALAEPVSRTRLSQADAAARPAAQRPFAIKGFAVTGDNPLGSAETSAILAPFLQGEATLTVLEQARAALEKTLHERGYSLYRVLLPPQALGETVGLTITRSTLGKLDIQGNDRYFDNDNVRHALPELKQYSSPNMNQLGRQMALANENPSRKLTVEVGQPDENDVLRATVRVRESRPWSAALGWDNNGDPEAGNARLSAAGSYNNLFGLDHVLGAAYTSSVEHPHDGGQFGMVYRAPIPSWGGMAFASYIDSDVAGSFGLDAGNEKLTTFYSSGDGKFARMGYAQYLLPSGAYSAYIALALEDRLYRASELDGQPVARERRSRPISLAYAARDEEERRLLAYKLEFVFNAGGRGAASELEAYQSENPEITTTGWKALRGSASVVAEMASGWQFVSRLLAQYSPDLLLAGEAFGLGGVASVRGAPERALYGDSGVSATLEGATPQLVRGLRVAAFLDAGAIKSDMDDRETRKARDHLASVGLGLRYVHPVGINLAADYGYIVLGSRVNLPDNQNPAPQKGDDKLHLSLTYVF